MRIERLTVGMLSVNCYLLMDEETRETAVIDPGGDGDRIIAQLEKDGASVKFILLTHGHFDHTGAVYSLKKKYDAPVLISEKDYELIKSGISELFYIEGNDGSIKDFIKDGDILRLGNLEIKCIETPGHTPGGMSFCVDDVVFTGDSLFHRSIGRTDFIAGDYKTLINSIKKKLLILPDMTKALPGHGEATTILKEKSSNPFISELGF